MKTRVKNKKYENYISLGALLTSTRAYEAVAIAKTVIEMEINEDSPEGRKLKKYVKINKSHTYIKNSARLDIMEFLEKNNFDLSPKKEIKIAEDKPALLGINQFLKYPATEEPVNYNVKLPEIRPLSIGKREILTQELEKKIRGTKSTYYPATQIMKMICITPGNLSRYLNELGPLQADNNGLLGYADYRVLNLARRVLEDETRRSKAETL